MVSNYISSFLPFLWDHNLLYIITSSITNRFDYIWGKNQGTCHLTISDNSLCVWLIFSPVYGLRLEFDLTISFINLCLLAIWDQESVLCLGGVNTCTVVLASPCGLNHIIFQCSNFIGLGPVPSRYFSNYFRTAIYLWEFWNCSRWIILTCSGCTVL